MEAALVALPPAAVVALCPRATAATVDKRTKIIEKAIANWVGSVGQNVFKSSSKGF